MVLGVCRRNRVTPISLCMSLPVPVHLCMSLPVPVHLTDFLAPSPYPFVTLFQTASRTAAVEISISVHPSVEKKHSGLGLRWVGADAGNETRISRLDLCSLIGLESLVC